jgi:hypothetical protein
MKTKIKNLLLLLLLLGLPGVVQAQNAYSTNADGSIYTYSTNADGSANIVAYAGPPWVVTIPTNINGLTVTSIGTNAFYASSLTSVTIPNSVTSIGWGRPGRGAFEECASLTNVTIGNSVTSIGYAAFGDDTSLTSVTIPGSVTSIGTYAFASCTSLTNVTIDNGVTSIGFGAFENDISLTNVTIPGSVTSIVQYSFLDCFGLTSINVDASNPAYSSMNGVLFDKAQATLIEFPGGLGGSYTITNSVTSIGDYAFYTCIALTSVTIPNSITSIANEAFDGCESLTSVTIPDSVISIGEGAFAYTSLNSVTIPGSVTSIGANAFSVCSSLTSVTVGNGVISIGTGAFSACGRLTSVYFQGNSPTPTNDSTVFLGFIDGNPSNDPATVYYLPGTTGWGATFDGLPTALWYLPNPQILNFEPSFGVETNGFGFTISWATNASIVVQAATNLANPVWIPVSTSPLTNGTSYFSDPQWTNYPERFYRATSAFTVGGTLTGLPAGDTVTLQDNGSDSLTLSTNGTFTFPTALPNGQSYSVTVSGTSGGTTIQTEIYPPVTANGSGTISGANVTNVAVQCTPIYTGILDEDMYNAAVLDGTANGGVPGVMLTENGGPFRVTAEGRYSDNIARIYTGSCVFTHVVGTGSCSSTTLTNGGYVIQFGTFLNCDGGPFRY